MIVDGQAPFAPGLLSFQCLNKTVFLERSCKGKTVDTTLKTISKKRSQPLWWFFNLSIHFDTLIKGFYVFPSLRNPHGFSVLEERKKRGKGVVLVFWFLTVPFPQH